MSWVWTQQFLVWQRQLANGLDPAGNLIANIEPTAQIVGRGISLGVLLQFIDDGGVVMPEGLPAATSAAQGAVKLAVGAAGNTLGSAAMQPVSAFDAAGAAAAAEAAGIAAAAAAQAAAEAFASDAGNISSGTLDPARLPGISVVITTAALTPTGTQGSMTFTNGLLTAQVQAT